MTRATRFTCLATLMMVAGIVCPLGAVEVFLDATRSEVKKIPIAVFTFKDALRYNGYNPTEVLKADLRRSLLFQVAELARLGVNAEVTATPTDEDIRKTGAAGVTVQVWGQVEPRTQGGVKEALMQGTLFDFTRGEVVGTKRYVGEAGSLRTMMHRLADELVFQYTGEQGIARSRIAFVSERDGAKELFVMDYDGYYPRQVTFDAFLNLAPSWSPDKRRLAFTSYRGGGDPKIEELDLATGRRRVLVDLPGLNITPDWAPGGEELAFATTKDGNAEIYKVDKDGKKIERLTDHKAADLAPSWSPTGRELAFTSDRGGTPQVYLMGADGTNVRRLTFEGNYNTAAAWSPKGKWIAYVCRDDRSRLKLCLISPDGQQSRPLTSGPGNDESPSWSADGRHVVFSSSRSGKRDIYMINVDGTDLERLTTSGGLHDDPAWSAP